MILYSHGPVQYGHHQPSFSTSSMTNYGFSNVAFQRQHHADLISNRRRRHMHSSQWPHFPHQQTSRARAQVALHGHITAAFQPMVACRSLVLSPLWSFIKFMLVFVAGGLFFSTAAAGFTACYAMGIDNVQRIWILARSILVQVWRTFRMGLTLSKQALLGESLDPQGTEKAAHQRRKRWKWRTAWKVLQEELKNTRNKAAEGIQALRQEAQSYAAVLGPPGLIPIQHVINQLMPLSIGTLMEQSLKESLADMRVKNIKKFVLAKFDSGTKSPTLESARVYDLQDALAFDCKMKWDSEVEATVQVVAAQGLARFPVTIKNFQFEGSVRVLMTPLSKKPPGYGAILVSFPSPPKINMDIRVAGGEITRVPWLKSEILKALKNNLQEEAYWPRRLVIPQMDELNRPLLSKAELQQLQHTDPLLQAEELLAETPMLKDRNDAQNATSVESLQISFQENGGEDDFDDRDKHYTSSTRRDVQSGIVWQKLSSMLVKSS